MNWKKSIFLFLLAYFLSVVECFPLIIVGCLLYVSSAKIFWNFSRISLTSSFLSSFMYFTQSQMEYLILRTHQPIHKWSQNENFFISERFSLKIRLYNHFLNLFRVMYYKMHLSNFKFILVNFPAIQVRLVTLQPIRNENARFWLVAAHRSLLGCGWS